MSKVRFTITFIGRVQGVFFRATTLEVSRRFDVAGWVRNERDGSVRCIAEGERDELTRFMEAVREAKRANIDESRVEESPATGDFQEFGIRY